MIVKLTKDQIRLVADLVYRDTLLQAEYIGKYTQLKDREMVLRHLGNLRDLSAIGDQLREAEDD